MGGGSCHGQTTGWHCRVTCRVTPCEQQGATKKQMECYGQLPCNVFQHQNNSNCGYTCHHKEWLVMSLCDVHLSVHLSICLWIPSVEPPTPPNDHSNWKSSSGGGAIFTMETFNSVKMLTMPKFKMAQNWDFCQLWAQRLQEIMPELVHQN